MKFSILQSQLLKGLQKVSGVVPTKSTTPALENILFEIQNNELKITGTDLEVSITTAAKIQDVQKEGAIALPAKVITEMIRSLSEMPIHFELDENNRIKIKTEQGVYQISGISKENFPEVPKPGEEKTIEMDSQKLGRMFGKTIFAVSSDELRPALMGVFMQISNDEFRMVATDGHRLSKIVDKSFRFDQESMQMILPPKAIQIALKNLDDEGKTTLEVGENGLSFVFDETILFTRLVEGQYPDYERVIPGDNHIQVHIDRNQLMASVRRVSIFSSALTHQIRFAFEPGKLVIFSEDMDIGGEAREELKVDYNEESMEIGYNSQYVLDILKNIDTEEVVFKMKNPVSAALVTPSIQQDDEELLMLLMPIKLSS